MWISGKLCYNHLNCKFWTYGNTYEVPEAGVKKHTCWLKDGNSGGSYVGGVISGTANCYSCPDGFAGDTCEQLGNIQIIRYGSIQH